ncbi:MAG: DNA topoisomerase IV subunit A [Clostridiaceae bacterium]
MAKKIEIPKDNNIVAIAIEEAMPDNYLPYAVEVAKERALPDVRDGLKPVHRRILYGAYQLKAFPDKPYFKSARIVGDILGKYHPHGDASVYESMVIMAQDFSTRMPIIDGHGNWGSIDGDGAAAMRYTEARLTPIAMEMLRDIDKGIVNMVPNYSDSEMEPEVLPARFPNLLVNGTFGIAVGLATNIPPHNLGEVIDGTLALIDNEHATTKELMQYIKGPDLPTGGILIGENSIEAAYETGNGKVALRAKCSIEKLENDRWGIVIKEFPYRRNKAKLLQTISDMTGDKKHAKVLESIADIRDESDRTGIRSVIEFKKSADEKTVDKVLKYLFKKTELQINISFNMVAIANGKPETLTLKGILKHYINHQKDIVGNRCRKELEVAKKRFHIVEGFIKAIGIMDDIIKEIRASSSKKDALNNLVSRFGFTNLQAESILELMLYRLTGLEIVTFEQEYAKLEKEINRLTKILSSEKELFKLIKKELLEIKNKYSNERRTSIIKNDEQAKINKEELIIIEDIMITLSNEGFIKMVPLKSYARSNTSVSDIEYREGDFNKFLIKSNTLETIFVVTEKGNIYQFKASLIPEYKWKEKGEKLDSLIRGLNLNNEKIIGAYAIKNIADSEKEFLFITSKGFIKKTELNKYNTNYTKIMALKLKNEERLIYNDLRNVNEEEKFLRFKTQNGLEFVIEEPKIQCQDRNILGQSLFYLPESDNIIEINIEENYIYKSFALSIDEKGNIKPVSNRRYIRKNGIGVFTNTSSKLVLFLKDGRIAILDSFIFSELNEQGINLSLIIDDFNEEKSKVLNVISTFNFTEELDVIYFTKKGYVKKSQLREMNFNGNTNVGYKLKENDDIINVEIVDANNKDIIIVTRYGMCIRFSASQVNYMGRIASGVTGISTKDDDCVVFAKVVNSKNNGISELAIDNSCSKILLKTMNNIEAAEEMENIKQQNRAGIGKNIMLVAMGDYIKQVKLV